MLLVLASPADLAADRLAASARAAGVDCARPLDWRDVHMSVHAERDCTLQVDIRVGAEAVPATAVFSRGLALSWSTDQTDRFRYSEVMSTWWTALATFTGPVINRPSRAGYTPILDLASLAVSVPGLGSRSFIAPPRADLVSGPEMNVHRLRDGLFIGRFAETPVLDEDELYVYTPFDPTRVVRLLVAGRRAFDLSKPDGRLDGELAQRLGPLVRELRRQEATFSLALVELTDDRLYLLHATTYPPAHQYQHIEAAVHQALLEVLAP
jgi:hypothetical protein